MKNYYSTSEELVSWLYDFAHGLDAEYGYKNTVEESLKSNKIIEEFEQWNSSRTKKPFVVYFYEYGTIPGTHLKDAELMKLIVKYGEKMRYKVVVEKDHGQYVEEAFSFNESLTQKIYE